MIEWPAPLFRGDLFRVPSRGEKLPSLSLPYQRTKSRRTKSTIDMISKAPTNMPFPRSWPLCHGCPPQSIYDIPSKTSPAASISDARVSPATCGGGARASLASCTNAPGRGTWCASSWCCAYCFLSSHRGRGVGTCCFVRCNEEEKQQCTSEPDLLRRGAGDLGLLQRHAGELGR